MKSLSKYKILFFLPFLFLSCSLSNKKYALITWDSADLWLKNDTIYLIKNKNNTIPPSYTIKKPKCKKCKEITIYEDKTFFEKFNNLKEAKKRQARYGKFKHFFGFSKEDNVKVRNSPNSNQNNIIYRLSIYEKFKILYSDQKDNIFGKKDYWYYIQLANGLQGYVFGSAIDIRDVSANELTKTEFKKIEYIFSKKWYPLIFKDMIEQGVYNLNVFKPEYGFFVSLNKKDILIQEQGYDAVFYINHIYKEREFFVSDNGNIKFKLLGKDSLLVNFKLNGVFVQRIFVALDFDIKLIYENEVLKRKKLLDDFGGYLKSRSYGFIGIEGDGNFLWHNNKALVPNIIPSEQYIQGKLLFENYISENLRDKYTSIVTFYFKKQNYKISFLYKIDNNTLYLYYFDNSLIKKNYLQSEPDNLVTMLFLRNIFSKRV